MSTQDSPKSTSIVVPGSTLRCTKASFLVVAVLSPATYRRTVRAGSGPAIGSNNRRIRFAVNRGSSRSHCLIRSRHGSRVPGRGGDTRTGGVDRLMARRTVFTSNFNRRAISFFGTLSTRCKCRISAHWDILITSASSWLGRRDDRVSPRRSSPGDRCSECSGGPFLSGHGVPFHVAATTTATMDTGRPPKTRDSVPCREIQTSSSRGSPSTTPPSAHIGQGQRAAHRTLSEAGPNGPVSIETVGLLLECMLVVQEKERDEGVKYHVKGKPRRRPQAGR